MRSLGSGWPSVKVEGAREAVSRMVGGGPGLEGSAGFLDMVRMREGVGEDVLQCGEFVQDVTEMYSLMT